MPIDGSASPRRVLAVLFFGVLIAALDIAIVGPALPALQDAFDVDRRTIAWVFNVFVLANLVSIPLMSRLADLFGRRIGPIFAGIVLGVAGWSWLFWMTVPLAVVVAGIGWRVLPATRADNDEQLDVAGMVVIGVLLAALAYGVNQIDTQAVGASLFTLETGFMVMFAVLLVPVFIRIERRAADPLLRLDLFASRQVQVASALAVGAGLTEAAFIFFPDLAVAAFGVSKSAASFMLLPLVIAVAIGSPVAGRLLDRIGVRWIVLMGTTLLAIGFAVMGGWPVDRVTFYGGSIAIGFGLACLLGSSLSYILLQESSAAERTVAQGVISLFLGIGQLLGGALIGAVAESGPSGVAGYAQAFLLIAGVAVVLLVLATQLQGRRAARSASEASAGTQ